MSELPMTDIWDELVGDRVIESPYQLEGQWFERVIFFESGKVMFFEDFTYEGERVTLYSSVEEFEMAEIDKKTLKKVSDIVIDAPGYKAPKQTDDATNVEFTLAGWIKQELNIQLSEEMARFVNDGKKEDN